jgi:hypothetical protein
MVVLGRFNRQTVDPRPYQVAMTMVCEQSSRWCRLPESRLQRSKPSTPNRFHFVS